jgi:predicted permease
VSSLKSDSAGCVGERGRAPFRRILVTSQIALSFLLLIAAGVFLRTLTDLRPTEYRTRTDQVLLFTMKPQQEIYTIERKQELARELVRRVSALPGVQTAALAEYGPLGSRDSADPIQTPGGSPVEAQTDWVSPGFFSVIGIPWIAGRDFTAGDKPGTPRVAIVNESLARSLFAGENPVGRQLQFARSSDKATYEIVGVVRDTRYYEIHSQPRPTAWFAFQGKEMPYMPTLHVRTADANTAPAIAAIRREFDTLDKGIPIFNIKTLERRMMESLSRERMMANIATAFGGLALLLASVGIYGILAWSVSRRTREIGIRRALGCGSGGVLWMVAREGLLLVGLGSILGTAVALAVYRVAAAQLAGISAPAPSIVVACAAVLFVAAILAVSIPAIRACRFDPLRALRHD